MFCPHCGKPVPENAAFCQNCGSKLSSHGEEASGTPFQSDLSPFKGFKEKFASPLFLALTILVTCIAGAYLIFNGSLQILHIFIAIGLWFMYSAATSDNDTLLVTGIKFVSIPVKIAYVIVYVGAGLLAFSGLMIFSAFSFVGATIEEIMEDGMDAFLSALETSGIEINFSTEAVEEFISLFGSVSAVTLGLILFVAFIIVAIILIVFNLIFLGSFSKYLTAAKKSLVSCEPFEIYDKSVSVRLMVYGILTALPVISVIFDFTTTGDISIITSSLSSCLTCAICIVASVFIKKNAPENLDM